MTSKGVYIDEGTHKSTRVDRYRKRNILNIPKDVIFFLNVGSRSISSCGG